MAFVVSTSSIQSMAGMTVAIFGVLSREKNKVASLKICGGMEGCKLAGTKVR